MDGLADGWTPSPGDPWTGLSGSSYAEMTARFRWRLPERFNIAHACADAWAMREPGRICLIEDRGGGTARHLTYGDLSARSKRLAGAFASRGIGAGDRVAIVLAQGFEAAVAHLAVYRLGAIAVPLALRFGPEALGFRLRAAGVKLVVIDASGLATLAAITEPLADLAHVVAVGADRADLPDFAALEHETNEPPQEPRTVPDDPAMIIFTSGTTGPPKGALHGHRVLLGHLPGIVFCHDGYGLPGDRMWTPSDWAWAGGLLNALLPSLLLGVPVVFSADRFRPEEAFALMARQKVRNAFLPATALRMMKASASDEAVAALTLRSIGSAGESLPRDTYEWAQRRLSITVNEFYGQTECNMVLGSSAALGISRAGAIGRAIPGHDVEIVDPAGRVLPRGETGTIAVRTPDPVKFLRYWNEAAATADKFAGGFLLTGDQGSMDEAGFVSFFGRADDVITSAGYRIGPGEIEDCLMGHPAVKLVAVVGKPDPLRTEIVKAYVVLDEGVAATEATAQDLQRFVREKLSAHEYPREIGFVDDMELTTSGKIIRRHFRRLAEAEAAAGR